MKKFHARQKLPELTPEESDNLISFIFIKEMEFILKRKFSERLPLPEDGLNVLFPISSAQDN